MQVPLRQLFSYLPPPDRSADECAVGSRLWVPFGRSKRLGIVLACERAAADDGQLRPALELLDDEPLLHEVDLELARFTWSYYHLAPGQVLAWLLPPQLRKQKYSDVLAPAADAAPRPPPSPRPGADKNSLTDEQSRALQALSAQLSGFSPTLLQGVTGSGKTEVYMRCADRVLQQGGQVLWLVPEIGLTPQAQARIKAHTDATCASIHSRVSAARRLKLWNEARTGALDVLVGTRSAVFTPMPRLGLIVVDEEHDSSLRQDQGAPYSARDLAIWRAQQRQIPVILGSATPSLETLARAQSGSYRHLQLRRRVDGQRPPAILLVDRRKVPPEQLYSPQTLDEIRAQLDGGQQALLFLNRRGWARTLTCPSCGWRNSCSSCDAPATLHMMRNALVCHYCGRSEAVPRACPECGDLPVATGPGTEKLEQWCQRQFPSVPVLRVDSDSTRKVGSLAKMLKLAESETPAILVGTRMLTKGHHLPHLGLVAIADASLGLLHPDFRTAELSAQTIIQVAGRAGREMAAGGRVLLETSMPAHSLLKMLAAGDYPKVAAALMEQRRRNGLPPFVQIAMVTAESSRRGEAMRALNELRQKLGLEKAASSGLTLVGPMPRALEKRDNRWRALLQLRSHRRSQLHRALREIRVEADSLMLADSSLQIQIVIDPLETL